MPTVSLTETLTATTPEPRDSFPSLKELRQLGFPGEGDPNFNRRYEAFTNGLDGEIHLKTPRLRVMEDAEVELLAEAERATGRITATGRINSFRNCGGKLQAPGATPFTFAMGRWVVPLVRLVEADKPAYCASWVGIDGFTTPTRPLIRVGAYAFALPITNVRTANFFFQWLPEKPIILEDVHYINQGDRVSVTLWVGPVGSRTE
jgi:hypothetical protein